MKMPVLSVAAALLFILIVVLCSSPAPAGMLAGCSGVKAAKASCSAPAVEKASCSAPEKAQASCSGSAAQKVRWTPVRSFLGSLKDRRAARAASCSGS